MQPSLRHSSPFWLPFAVSVALHAAFGAALFCLPFRGIGEHADSVVLDTHITSPPQDEDFPVFLIDPPRVPRSPILSPIMTNSNPVLPTVAAPPHTVTTSSPITPVANRDDSERPASTGSGSHSRSRGVKGAATAFFQLSARGRSVVYVLDRSVSMGLNGALTAVKRELLSSLEQLPSEARFQVIFYNRQTEPLVLDHSADMVPASASTKRQVEMHLEKLLAEGGTDHVAALRRALSLRPDVIFFLTDADDLKIEHVRTVSMLNRGRSVIHAIEIGDSVHGKGDSGVGGSNPLRRLAQENGGDYRAVTVR